MRSVRSIAAALLITTSLSGCAAYNSATTGKPLDPAQVRQDLAIAAQALREAGCLAAVAGAAAAPIVAVTADAQGNKVLSAVGASGGAICTAPAPAAIVSAPGTTLGAVAAP